jgi:hypothetical protein
MGTWVTVDEAYVRAAMSAVFESAYSTFLFDDVDHAGRLDILIAGALADFREGLRVEAAEALDPDVTKVPERCARHVVAYAQYYIAIEMSASVTARGGVPRVESIPAPGEGGTAVSMTTVSDLSDIERAFVVAKEFRNRLYAGQSKAGFVGTPHYGPAAARPVRAIGW